MNIIDRFWKTAYRYPKKTALVCGSKIITYFQLSNLINVIVVNLLGYGILKGDVIAIYAEKSIDMIAIMLASLQIGAIYVPIDSRIDTKRAIKITLASKAKILLCDDCYLSMILASLPDKKLLKSISSLSIKNEGNVNSDVLMTKNEDINITVCILYTSGTVSEPKGVIISQHNILIFINWAIQEFNITDEDILANHASLGFDLAILDLYATLLTGATLHLLCYPFNTMHYRLVEYIIKHNISIWYSVPAILISMAEVPKFNENYISSLRLILYAGENYPIRQLCILRKKFNSLSIYNLYGPTETNVCSYYKILENIDTNMIKIPIGKPCPYANLSLSFLPNQSCTNIGELLITSKTTSKGYWLSSDIKQPYHSRDIVKFINNSIFEYIGRSTSRFKYAGRYLWIEDLECIVNMHNHISQCIIFPKHEDVELKSINLVINAKKEVKKNEINQLFLQYDYPLVTIDNIYHTDRIYRTLNGKLDRDSANLQKYM